MALEGERRTARGDLRLGREQEMRVVAVCQRALFRSLPKRFERRNSRILLLRRPRGEAETEFMSLRSDPPENVKNVLCVTQTLAFPLRQNPCDAEFPQAGNATLDFACERQTFALSSFTCAGGGARSPKSLSIPARGRREWKSRLAQKRARKTNCAIKSPLYREKPAQRG